MHHRNQELVATLELLRSKEIALEKQVAEDAILKMQLSESKQQLEARVLERTQSLLLSNEELRSFSYTVSHDLRAPLRAINGYVSILLEDHVKSDDAEARAFASAISQATDRMDELVHDLVVYTGIAKEPTLHEVDSQAVLKDLLAKVRSLTPAHAKITTSGEFPVVIANHTLLQNSFIQLYENAVKFRKPNAEVSIRLRGDHVGDCIRFWVEDDGIGIAPEHHARIFKVFERLHGKEFSGTGIGLALVKRWISVMGGTVGVESQLGEGSRFWIQLPLSHKAPRKFSTAVSDPDMNIRNGPAVNSQPDYSISGTAGVRIY
jgi:signal transduction histidine kinase